ncbi:response regulator transcription factor [Helicobacter muridarum]|uniref:Phosphate regulon response regulator n=1 Tax=Helicobacter muridarum TaxID=216 RepID=A0A099U009_9HELI|nr:response regulator transcription factor [Helicobacter muridarum]TLE00739.1 response regulator transcription factor [Helicobacter muridarum]STQ86583.1 phosphate regulon response regulator [Helicobacter muridarum]
MGGVILCIDDDKDLLDLLELNLNATLGQSGFETVGCLNTQIAWRFIEKECIAFILMDKNLAADDGLQFAKQLKDSGYDIPIIFLSALSTPFDKISALEYADDYITKPFDFDEVIARIFAVLRRYSKNINQKVIKYKGIALNKHTKELCIDNLEITLSPLEARIMFYFIKNGGQILTRSFLLNKAWGDEKKYHENSVNVAIKRLRKKIEKETNVIKIKSIRGRGYKLC